MAFSITTEDEEFGVATGANVNPWGSSRFDGPPTASTGLVITPQSGDTNPRLFELGDTYDLTWNGNAIANAVVIRSDPAPSGGGTIVFEGTDQNGGTAQIIWSPGGTLNSWYQDSLASGTTPRFHTTDQNAAYTHEYVCFEASARILTTVGSVAAGDIRPGMLVMTLDRGPQTVLWAGRREMAGRGASAPVLFTPGTLSNEAPLLLSQQHRVLVRDARAELLFGTSEVLVPAKAMVDGQGIRIEPRTRIGYVHLLTLHHEILEAEGAPCESLLMTDRNRVRLPVHAAARYMALCRQRDYAGPMRSARRSLSYAEALTLLADCGKTPAPKATNPRARATGVVK